MARGSRLPGATVPATQTVPRPPSAGRNSGAMRLTRAPPGNRVKESCWRRKGVRALDAPEGERSRERGATMSHHRPPSGRGRDDRRKDDRRVHRYERGETRAAPSLASDVPFICGHCGRRVGPLPSGGRNRNHCPYCLYSRHVDGERSGDRGSACQGMMAPIGVFERPNGEEVITHRCQVCGFERFNRVGADDDEATVAALPRIEARQAPRER